MSMPIVDDTPVLGTQAEMQAGREPVIVGGCIRLYPASSLGTPRPQWHVDEGHHTIGINYANNGSNEGRPRIDESGFLVFNTLNRSPIVAATCAIDETLSSRGITAGISNGTHLVRIRFYSSQLGRPLDLNSASDYAILAGPYNNVWITLVRNETPGINQVMA